MNFATNQKLTVMEEAKNRSLPLTTALARFVDVADTIKSRFGTDEILRDLCEDYHLARKTLTNLKKQRPRQSDRIAEYTVLANEIEDEIIRHLLSSGRQKRTR